MNMKILIVFLLAILVIISFVQSAQINNIKKSFSGDSSAVVAQSNPSAINTYNQPAANVPQMVGGC
ncbi:hypothetical protein J4458_00585 [Candidatus Woesearchaeota archaeon]|nr:hypothetical protein [Candidatus Woesearchaeota archaeon]